MNINIKQNGDKTEVAISGKLDSTTAPLLKEKLIPLFADSKYVEIDLAGLFYVSSAGLQILLMGEKTAKKQGSKQTLLNVSPEVLEVFEMTGFSGILDIS